MNDGTCATCLSLPRVGSWTSADDVPAAYDALVDLGDGLCACPSCPNLYRRAYEEEWEDGAYWESWSLSRLSPTEARALPGPHGERARAQYGETIARYTDQLSAATARLREDAGWALAHHYLDLDDWRALRHLVHECAPDAARAAAETIELSAKCDAAPPSFFVGAQEPPLPVVRMNVRRGLTHNRALVHEALETRNTPALAAAMSALDAAHRAGADVMPFFERLLELLGHPDTDVRRPAHWMLGRLDAPAAVQRVADRAIALLDDVGSVRADACRMLTALARLPPVRRALPRLIELLDDRAASWEAHRALAALGEAGVDLAPLRRVVIARVVRDLDTCTVQDLELLELVRAQGHDIAPAADAIVRLVSTGSGKRQSVAFALLVALIDAQAVTGEPLDAAQAVMPSLYGAQTQRLAQAITGARWAAGDPANVRAMFASTTTVGWGAIDALREQLARGADLSTLLGAVRDFAAAHPGVVADHANRLLAEARLRAQAPELDLDELHRRLRAFREEVRNFDEWQNDFVPNPYEPDIAVAAVVALGPAAVPALCDFARGDDRELSYWAVEGLMQLGPAAGADAAKTLEALLGAPYVGRLAAQALSAVDPQRFAELGLAGPR